MKKIFALTLACGLLLAAPAAAQNPAQAQNELMAAIALEYSPETAPDYPAAAARYQAAAQAGSREALLALARLHAPEGPLWQGPELWQEHLLTASRAGWPEASYRLAKAVEDKVLDGQNPASFYFQAAAAGYGPAAKRLGEIYLEGLWGLSKDEKLGATWLTVAAENHEPEAALALGRLYYEQKPDTARRWLERAQSPEGYYLLGELYLKDKRFIEAVSAFTVAADQNYAPAHLALGRQEMENEFGRRGNRGKALRHFKIAAQAGLPEGAYRLAHMYLKGEGTPADSLTAAFWLFQAGAKGHEAALEEYEKLSRNFTIGQKKRLDRMIEEGVTPSMRTPVQ